MITMSTACRRWRIENHSGKVKASVTQRDGAYDVARAAGGLQGEAGRERRARRPPHHTTG